jgi:membrane associated rhomboid family serine protease
MLTLPAFRGFTRRIILIELGVFFGLAVLGLVSRQFAGTLVSFSILTPGTLWPQIWRPVTYTFVALGLFNTLLMLLSFWFFASFLEDERGSRWLAEFFFVSAIGGGVAASVLMMVLGRVFPGQEFAVSVAATLGMGPVLMAILVAYARLFGEMEINLMFVVTLKAKYLAAIYVLVYLAIVLAGGDRFGAMTALCAAACGYGYLRLAPRRGLGYASSETWFGWRNAFYRAKRRKAAKKFEVYMRKQGKDVSVDAEGRYVDPSGKPRDPNDKRWMN